MTSSPPVRAAGLHVTNTTSTAVLTAADTGELERPPLILPTVVCLGAGGDPSLGEPDDAGLDSARDFVDRVGDPAGVQSEHGVAMRAEDLVATTLFVLLRDLTGPDSHVPAAAAYPPEWTSAQVDALRDALEFVGLSEVMLTADTAELRASAPDSDAGTAAAVGAARLAASGAAPVATPVADPSTETFAAANAEALTVAAYAAVPPPTSETVPESTPARTPGARRRTAFLVGAVVLSGLLLTAGIIGVVAQSNTPDTPVPLIESADTTSATATTTTQQLPAAGPVVFPTTVAVAPTPIVTSESDVPAPLPPAPEPDPVVIDVPPVEQPAEPTTTEAPAEPETPTTTTRRPGVSFPPCFPLGCAQTP